MIDLHMHSTFSDGSLTPEELVDMAHGLSLSAVALTDHDTMSGLPGFVRAAAAKGVTALTGVELSAGDSDESMHVLGYMVDPDHEELNGQLRWLQEGRRGRNAVMVDKLNAMGLELSLDDVQAHAGEDVVGRPHIALALAKKGYVKNKNEAFRKYLADGKAAYARRPHFSPAMTFELIRLAGGVPVVAHPGLLRWPTRRLRKRLLAWKEQGLLGLEVYYPEHSQDLQRHYLRLAEEVGLVATGGSDFHGALSPRTRMGRGFGKLDVPDHVVERLKEVKPGG